MFEIYSIHGRLMDRIADEATALRCFDSWAYAWNVLKDGKPWISRPTFTAEQRAEILATVANAPYIESGPDYEN